ANAVAFYAMAIGGWALRWAFLIGAALVLARLAVIGALAFAEWLSSRKPAGARESGSAGGPPFVSVIIAAYNEERVIAQAVASLLRCAYARCAVVVIERGWSD